MVGISRFAALGVVLLIALASTESSAQNLRDLAKVLDASAGRVIALDDQGRPISSGSGYAVAVRGEEEAIYFLTNNHVIDGTAGAVVGYGEADGVKLFDAELVNRSAAFDMALLKLTADDHDFVPRRLPLAEHDIAQGDAVYAIGFPGSSDVLSRGFSDPAFFEPTLTQGIVSKRFEASWSASSMRIDMVQHDAVINSGNSGGPLTSRCGVVLGLNTAGAAGGGAQGTFWSSSAVSIAAFLANAGVPPVTVTKACDGRIVSVGSWQGRHSTLLVGSALVVAAAVGGIMLFRTANRPLPGLRIPRAVGASAQRAPLVLARIGSVEYPLAAERLKRGIIIGRGEGAGLRVEDTALSREHAHLQLRDRKLFLQDLGSTNGTRVGGQSLAKGAPVQINTKSEISLGGVPLRLGRPGAGSAAK